MSVKIFDYSDKVSVIDIDITSDEITDVFIEVVTGDEILNVLYKDGTEKRFDSLVNDERVSDFSDWKYYLKRNGILSRIWLNEDYQNRNGSLWFLKQFAIKILEMFLWHSLWGAFSV